MAQVKANISYLWHVLTLKMQHFEYSMWSRDFICIFFKIKTEAHPVPFQNMVCHGFVYI